MEWNKGYTATYYAEVVDAESWRGTERLELIGGKVSRTDSGLRQSADLDCRDEIGERYIRVWMDAKQGAGSEHIPLFTGLASQPGADWNGYTPTRTLECYSVLKPADDVQLQRGYYVLAGMDAGKEVRKLLSVTPAPVDIVGTTPSVSQTIVAENNESNLTMVDKILTAIGWDMRILGDGTIQIYLQGDTIAREFNSVDNDSIEPSVKVTRDWYSCPNVLQVISDDQSAIVKDQSDSSFLSIQNRGREIWRTESNAELSEDESIAQYAMRRLREEQSVAYSVGYDRRFDADLNIGDVVGLQYPALGITGKYRIRSQSIALGYGARTSEEVYSIG